MSASLRERLAALRPASSRASAREASPAAGRDEVVGSPGLAAGIPAEAQVVTTRVLAPGWAMDGAAERATMRRMAQLAREPALESLRAEDLLFLDLETTGLSLGAGTVAFLFGTARVERGEGGAAIVVEQRLLRALSHERPVLEVVRSRVEAAGALVTFNGKSYDIPLLAGRCVLHRLGEPPRRPHFDALHPARRLLSHAMADVRLTSLEAALWDERRPDDLGGAAVPAAFFAALRGDDTLLDDVLRHNLDDLVTLARLPPMLSELAAGGGAPTGLRADALALAGLRVEHGDREGALEAVEACRTLPGSPRSIRRARLARKAGGPAAARDHWRRLCREPRAGLEPHVELAKILEHHDRDPAAALAVVAEALRRFGEDPAARAELERRQARLMRRLARGGFPAAHHPG